MIIPIFITAISLAPAQDESARQELIDRQIETIAGFVLTQNDQDGDGQLDRDEFTAFALQAAKNIGEVSGKMPTAEEIDDKILEAFTFDEDGSGTLSRAELVAMSRSNSLKGVAVVTPVAPTNPKSMRMAKYLVGRFDTNADDKLDRTEFRAATEWIRTDTEQRRNIEIERTVDELTDEWMSKHDANEDGHISIAELAVLHFE